MDKAKHAVQDFMSKSGHNDTTVHEKAAPAVTQEHISKERHEEVQTAVDREVHQDHYHTSVQPVKDREVLPEQHQHRLIPVEHREHQHGKDRAVKESLDQERTHFRDTRTEGDHRETHATAPSVAGEHVHHHVHETIQPVVQKETIQPSVVHTTVPIHEVHHNDPKHHAASALPAVSMADFKKQGGALSGREEKYDGFAGEPKSLASLGTGTHGSHTTGGPHDSNLANKVDPRVDSDRDGSRNAGMTQTSGNTGYGSGSTGTGYGSNTGTGVGSGVGSGVGGAHGNHGTTGGYGDTTGHHTGSNTTDTVTGKEKKPSLMDRLNPKKDTDRDGKAGFMD